MIASGRLQSRPRSGTGALPAAGSVLAVLAALLTGGLFLLLMGKDPLSAYGVLLTRGLGSTFGITETLIQAAPLLMVSAGLLIALRAGVWNIGIDGQFLTGALLAGVVAPALAGDVWRPVLLLVAALAGVAGGMAWGLVPALLKVRYGLNEIITTVMMNYVAIYLTSWLVKGPFKDPDVVPPQTRLLPPELRLPDIPGSRVHIGLIVGILVALAVVLLFRSTTLGFRFWILGQNRRAAVHAGWPVGRLTVLAMLLSGGLAGLAGANDVLGVKGLFQGEWDPAYGLTAFALVFLARLNGLWLLPFAYVLSLLLFSADFMPRAADVPTAFVDLLEGLMLAFLALMAVVERGVVRPQPQPAATGAADHPPETAPNPRLGGETA